MLRALVTGTLRVEVGGLGHPLSGPEKAASKALLRMCCGWLAWLWAGQVYTTC